MRGLASLREHGVDWNALTTVHAANVEHPVDVYRFLRDECGAAFIQFIPIVERPNEDGVPYGDTVTERSVTAEAVGRLPHRRLRGVGAARRRRGLRADVRRRAGQLVRRAVGPVRALADLRHGAGHGAQRRRLRLRPLRRAGLPAGEHRRAAAWRARRARRSSGSFGHDKLDTLPQYLPRLRRALRLPRRLPQGPLHHHARRREPGLNYLCAGFKAFFHHVDPPCAACASCCARIARRRRSCRSTAGGGEAGRREPALLLYAVAPSTSR